MPKRKTTYQACRNGSTQLGEGGGGRENVAVIGVTSVLKLGFINACTSFDESRDKTATSSKTLCRTAFVGKWAYLSKYKNDEFRP